MGFGTRYLASLFRLESRAVPSLESRRSNDSAGLFGVLWACEVDNPPPPQFRQRELHIYKRNVHACNSSR